MAAITPSDVLDFWYATANRKFWFAATPEMDALIKSRFEAVWQRASQHQLDAWLNTAAGCLALAIVLDQFPLNMFRGEARGFATEQQAVQVTKYAVGREFHLQLPKERVAFLIMPLMHSENIVDQNESVRLFSEVGAADNLRFARHHRDLIERFGRFPHRNAILGRESTAAELEYLASDKAFTG